MPLARPVPWYQLHKDVFFAGLGSKNLSDAPLGGSVRSPLPAVEHVAYNRRFDLQDHPEEYRTAMLRFFNQRQGMSKIILLTFVAVLVLGLGIVFALPSGRTLISSYTPIGASSTVASVDGYKITLSELKNQVRVSGMSQQMQAGDTDPNNVDVDSLYPSYGKKALDDLINAKIVQREADRLALGASTEEMRQRIVSMFTAQTGVWIGEQEYQTRVRMQGLTVEAFEKDIADSITEEKVRNFLTAGLTVSDREIEEDYRRTNTSMKPTYVLVAPKLDAVPPATEDELRAYFGDHKADFAITQQQRKISYVFIDQAALGATINVPDEELKQDYDPTKYVTALHVAQIVLKVPSPGEDGNVRKKADELAAKARGGADKPAEDFGELAKANSEDDATKANGGDAGNLEKSTLANGDSRERLFAMNVGQIGGPLKVGQTYVIYKILGQTVRPFEDVKGDLLAAARTRKAYSKGVELGQQVENDLKAKKDIQAVVNDLNASIAAAGGQPVASVRETPFILPGDQVPGLGASPQFDSEITALASVGDVGAVVGMTGGFVVPMVAEIREPHEATFEEVRDRVVAARQKDRARQVARDIATQLATATDPADLIAKSKAAGYDAKTQENFKAGGTLPDLQASDLLDSRLLALTANSVDKTPVDMPEGFIVLACADRKDPDMGDGFNQQRDSIRDRLLATKQGQFYVDYMKGVRKQLEESGAIEIYQDTIDRGFDIGGVDNSEEPVDESVPTLPPVGAPRPVTPGAPGKQ